MTRALQDRLALANVKIKHGWQNLSLDSIEPQIDRELKRKRPGSSNNTVVSDASSTVSDRRIYHNTSPLAPPIFSESGNGNGNTLTHSRRLSNFSKRTALNGPPSFSQRLPVSSKNARRAGTKANPASWKKAHRLPASSPTYRSKRGRYYPSHSQTLSFVSEVSTIPNDPMSPYVSTSCSEDDNHSHDNNDHPLASFNINTNLDPDITRIRSSPPITPRTPSPTPLGGLDGDGSSRTLRSQAFKPQSRHSQQTISGSSSGDNHAHNNNINNGTNGGRSRGGDAGYGRGAEGADLLLYLATSPSPANAGGLEATKTPRSRIAAPATPPPKPTPLPSSMMTTPGGTNSAMLGLGANTPSAGFNFADFVNITPSPAQGSWSRTPGLGRNESGAGGGGSGNVTKTPVAAREARRRLNFDMLTPRGHGGDVDGDGDDGRRGSGGQNKPAGLGMELGGELVS